MLVSVSWQASLHGSLQYRVDTALGCRKSGIGQVSLQMSCHDAIAAHGVGQVSLLGQAKLRALRSQTDSVLQVRHDMNDMLHCKFETNIPRNETARPRS
jgi:hypothetical protein